MLQLQKTKDEPSSSNSLRADGTRKVVGCFLFYLL